MEASANWFRSEPATHTRFDDLPPELRQKIWSLILPGPRLVTVNRFSKAPLALHINRESRFIALKHYALLHPQHLDHAKHTNGHRCVKGYIELEVDIIYVAGLTPCEYIDQKICHLQDNCWPRQHISSTRTSLKTDFALTKFLRMRSYKLMIHFDPNTRGVEYQNLPGRLTETGFQRKLMLRSELYPLGSMQ